MGVNLMPGSSVPDDSLSGRRWLAPPLLQPDDPSECRFPPYFGEAPAPAGAVLPLPPYTEARWNVAGHLRFSAPVPSRPYKAGPSLRNPEGSVAARGGVPDKREPLHPASTKRLRITHSMEKDLAIAAVPWPGARVLPEADLTRNRPGRGCIAFAEIEAQARRPCGRV